LRSNINHRRKISELYKNMLSEQGYRVVQPSPKAEPSYLRFPVLINDGPSPTKMSVPHTVLGTWFTSVLEEAISPVYGAYKMGSCPVAEEVAKHLINLPTHPRVNTADAEAIILDVLNTFNVARKS
jgi:dTDP-4-amino-4,6-dideoxygalactose transaminase